MSETRGNRPQVSVAIIVRNAATPLRETLATVSGLADELVVLDTGSTDETLSVVTAARAHVHRHTWDDHFAAARNACLEHCRGDWVLWLDAGERLTSDGAAELRQFVNEQADPGRAYLMPIELAAAGGVEQVWQVRLHPRRESLRFAGRVRESLDVSLDQAGVAIQPLAIAIQRALDGDPLTKSAKAQRNIRLADRSLAEQGPSAEMHNCLGEALQSLGDPLRAARQYQHVIRLAAPASRYRLEGYYGLLTCLDSAGPDRWAQLALCLEALDEFPLDAQLLVALGGYLQTESHAPLAVRAYDVAFRHGQIEPRIAHLPEIQELAAVCAAALLERAGDSAGAQTLLEAAVRTFPQSLRIARRLVESLVQQGHHDQAQALIDSLPAAIRAAFSETSLRLDQPRGLRIASPALPTQAAGPKPSGR